MTPYNEDARLQITGGRQQRFNELGGLLSDCAHTVHVKPGFSA